MSQRLFSGYSEVVQWLFRGCTQLVFCVLPIINP